MATDWESIKTEYILAPHTTLKQLAKRHALPYGKVAQQSAKGGWFRQKQCLRQEEKTQSPQAATQSEQAVQKGEECITLPPPRTTAGTLSQQRKINEIADRLLENIRISSEYTEKPTSIYNLTTALKNLTAVLRDVNDLPNIKEERSYELTKRKLELAQEKISKPACAQGGGVVLLPEVTAADAAE